MSTTTQPFRAGLRRGWREFLISLRNPEDLTFYLFWSGAVVVYLFLNRTTPVEGTTLTLPQVVLPGALAAMVVFGGLVGPAFALVIEKEDGTLLRMKAAPHGVRTYVTAQVVLQSLGLLPLLVLIVLPVALFAHPLMHRGAGGWVAVGALLVLALLATLPLGMVIGAVARKPGQVSTWGLLPVLGMMAISGIFVPITALWGWVQGVAQVLPMYWLGHGLRWAFLPDEARVLEAGETWRVLEALGVLGAWAAVGLLLAPRVLRRMARRESGSAVEARRQERMQRFG
ncbi:ABC transporter permease [Cellulomonas bogoriensis]|uniref:ABC transporter n=1 Tax=Cellulomonas bogoriensis 69B4 = DSM 16987 TaxID=1386082 RepID=A0A0A0BPB8_9CELL|nr:ABC transporter permease [Cellulomonas bogoriensis]KGM09751.1 ABC transporter [Cellulomonas bogoriensis 69B4 = DSM 16987]